jgi:hypothetical protein
VVEPSTAKDGPIPSMLMLESRVTFAPQLRGMEQRARSPRLDQAYSGVREVLVEHSSTNTKCPVSTLPATRTRQAALKNSSRSLAPTVLFWAKSHTPQEPTQSRLAH